MKRIKTVWLPKMSAKDLARLLQTRMACYQAISWSKGMTLRKVWRTCQRGDWMNWLMGNAHGFVDEWPAGESFAAIRNGADDMVAAAGFSYHEGFKPRADFYRKYIKVRP